MKKLITIALMGIVSLLFVGAVSTAGATGVLSGVSVPSVYVGGNLSISGEVTFDVETSGTYGFAVLKPGPYPPWGNTSLESNYFVGGTVPANIARPFAYTFNTASQPIGDYWVKFTDIANSQWGQESWFQTSIDAPIPEPSSLLLLGGGILGLVGFLRKRGYSPA